MARPLRKYLYYQDDRYICENTKRELAELIGVTEAVISNYISANKRGLKCKGIGIYPADEDPVYVRADIVKIKEAIKKEKVNYLIVSEWLSLKYITFCNKVNGHYRFSQKELSELEAIFRLEAGSFSAHGKNKKNKK